jgi:hypothetical protein
VRDAPADGLGLVENGVRADVEDLVARRLLPREDAAAEERDLGAAAARVLEGDGGQAAEAGGRGELDGAGDAVGLLQRVDRGGGGGRGRGGDDGAGGAARGGAQRLVPLGQGAVVCGVGCV